MAKAEEVRRQVTQRVVGAADAEHEAFAAGMRGTEMRARAAEGKLDTPSEAPRICAEAPPSEWPMMKAGFCGLAKA